MKQNARHLSVPSFTKIALTAVLSDASTHHFARAQGDPYIYVCVCVCIYIYIYTHIRARARTHTHTHTYIYIYTMHMKCVRAGLYEHINFVRGVVRTFLTSRQIHLEDFTTTERRVSALLLS